MTKPETILFKFAWAALALNGIAILVFGIIIAALLGPGDASYLRADGVASIGMGLFGTLIAAIPYRRLERYAWWTLWYYPLFWLAHLLGGLPPGQDHIHQVVFILLSLLGLLVPLRGFFPRGKERRE